MQTPYATPSERIAWTCLQAKYHGRWVFSVRGGCFIAETAWGGNPVEVFVGATVAELERKLGAEPREGAG